jgi:hypothetical protein
MKTDARAKAMLLALAAPLLLAALVTPALAAEPEEAQAAAEVVACAKRNLEEPDSVRAVRLTSRDRVGTETVIVVKLYGRRVEGGLRQLFVEFIEPEDMRGSSLLVLEREGENEVYFTSSELEKPKRITGTGKFAPLLGPVITFEDLEYIFGFDQPGESKLRDDGELLERPVHVLEIRPNGGEDSAYDRVVAYVDRETCVALRIEFYQAGRLRKEFSVNPKWIHRHGSVWIANMSMMRDVRDRTTTQVLVDSTDQEPIPEEMFQVKK